MRFLLVAPRFGRDIVGGAERLALLTAQHAAAADDVIEVATTCAIDHHTWANALDAGSRIEEGLLVHRFDVGPRDADRFSELHHRLLTTGRLDYLDELELMSNSVWSPGLQAFLESDGRSYDLMLFLPYLFGTTYWGLQAWPERSVLIPCLHDEPNAHMTCMREVVSACAGCIFNTEAEERLARRLFDVRVGGVVGLGFDPPSSPPAPGFAARHGLGDYLVYAGRLEEGKRVQIAAEYVDRYVRERGVPLTLALIGSGSYEPAQEVAANVRRLGWLTEEEKRSALAEAVALIHPSHHESLSIVLMEAWLESTPAILAAQSDVLRDHCEASGGGFTFRDYSEFAAAVERLSTDPDLRRSIGAAGKSYVHSSASWPAVRQRFRAVTREIAANARTRNGLPPTSPST